MTVHNKFTKDKDLEIIQMYKSGMNQVQIAKKFNTYNTSIRRVLLRHNIPIVSGSERLRKIKPDHFNDYSNPDIQYWIGVLLSDGCITKGCLVLAVKDYEWAEQFRNFLTPKINITKDPHNIWRVATRSKGITKELLKYGITPNKSLTLKFLKPFTPHVLRGIIDGDGCVYHGKSTKGIISISSGSKIFANQLLEYITSLGLNPTLTSTIANRKNRIYIVKLHRFAEIVKLYDILYPTTDLPKLNRKHDKYLQILKNINE